MSLQKNTLDFHAARVLVVGDVMLDRNWTGATERISPEAPVPVVNIAKQQETPGGAANVAMNIAALGGRVALVGLLGDDEAGLILRNRLGAQHIVDGLCTCDQPTITKLRVLSRHQQLIRLDFESRAYVQHSALILEKFKTLIDDYEVVVFSDYGKGVLHDVEALIALAKARGKTVLVDPKGKDFKKYHGADLVTPNLSELRAVMGEVDATNLLEQTRQCIADTGVAAYLVTQSEQGMTYIDARHSYHLAAQAREVFDVTGAGDTVIATLALAVAAGFSPLRAMTFANAAASVVVGKVGTATVSLPELQQALEPARARTHGIVSQEALLEHVRRVRAQGKRIVMTNGCFDILHAGHVTYLEEAKALGDRLIVAVNTDASVRRLKGPTRPANSLESRARVLAALQSVDWVVSFDSDTPRELIEAVSPDILVKGGDNKVEDIPGAQWVMDHGGEVKILSYVDGFSTTKTLNKYTQK